MEQLVTSDFKLGIIAGGQLGKMLVLAASNWDVKTYILDADEHCPASTSCTGFFKGNPLNYEDVVRFGKKVDLITFEIEHVNIEALKQLKADEKKYSLILMRLKSSRIKDCKNSFTKTTIFHPRNFLCLKTRKKLLTHLKPALFPFRLYKN